ncbi:transposase [Bacteroidales bacterium OttesenSCG-928-K03]|nr:transposase [Bacteroidales bacterium OttesenSCG-928-L14]MDL2240651.1 transposase [Bacteroidales bacterium OttesenSCG-928-K22]MDL2242433.1 transposase [Bacteroidales bacterium OttesenSCG-928-K03]
MSTNELKLSIEERQRRSFSESFKRKKVFEIESGQSKISDICKQYQVSHTSVHKWLKKYSSMSSKKERLIVETESDTLELLNARKRIAELERIIGQKQIALDFKDKMIEIAEDMYGVDIKKKLSEPPYNIIDKKD